VYRKSAYRVKERITRLATGSNDVKKEHHHDRARSDEPKKKRSQMMAIRVLLADDHRIVRDGLRTLITKQEDMDVVGEAEDGRSAIELTKKLLPDVVIMDVTMPDMNGITATRKIIEEIQSVKVIALSMHSDRRFVSGMMDAGALGYLLKDCAFEELADAIRTVYSNERYLSAQVADKINPFLNDPGKFKKNLL
jgi:DNA-binding NarL/FixJ family response regulator